MRRNATLSLDAFDPDVLDAARDAARRAGVPLEAWIASVVAPGDAQPAPRKRRTSRAPLAEPTPALGQPIEPAGPLAASMAEMMRRLEAIDARIEQDARESEAQAPAPSPAPHEKRAAPSAASEMTERLAAIERRMTEIGEQLAAPRPLGRRGRAGSAEVRDAVTEIRQRQRELEDAPAKGQRDAHANGRSSPAIGELQRETTRLRESIGGLATGRDVGALESAMQTLASGVRKAQEPADLAAIAAPIEVIRAQVDRLAEDVAENVHARVASDVERLAAKVDGAMSGGALADRDALGGLFGELDEIRRLIAALAGPERIQSLAQSLQAISAQISQLHGGDGSGMAELRPLLEEIRSGMRPGAPVGASDSDAIIHRIDALADKVERAGINPVGDLIGRLEDLGETLRRPAAPDVGLASIHGMLHDLAERLDRAGASPAAKGEGFDALEKQVLALADRIDTRGADPALASLERTMSDLLAEVSALREEGPAQRSALSESLEPPRGASDLGEIGLLRAGVADLRAHQTASEQRMQSTLNGVHTALERLVDRLGVIEGGAPAPDPFSERLLATTSMTAPRAGHRRPDMPRGDSPRGDSPRGDTLRADSQRADSPRADAEAFDLARLTDEPLEPGAARPGVAVPISKPSSANSSSAKPSAAKAGMAVEVDSALKSGARLDAAASTIAPSPRAGAGTTADDAAPEGDIKTSFIAAARRAAQAAQAEAESSAPARAGKAKAVASAQPEGARGAGLRAEIDKRRRPILLGLAAIVLALGALQATRSWSPPESPSSVADAGKAPIVIEAPAATPAESQARAADANGADVKIIDIKPAETKTSETKTSETKTSETKTSEVKPDATDVAPTRADPQTTQSIGDAPKSAIAAPPEAPRATQPVAARSVVPRVALMSDVAGDLSAIPTGFVKLRQAALDGDGAAIFELAARTAEGRGLPRDLGVAAKLYEKLAGAGYAPAQHRLAAQHEKGSGVTRDLAQAKLWYGRAADQGNARAMHNLAVLFAENPGASGKPDYATAAQWFRRAAEYGVRDSQYNLAVLSARGLGVKQDLMQSYAWFAAAAGQGDDDAGKKRDDVAAKLNPKDLAAARGLATAFKPKTPDPAINEPPAPTTIGPANGAVTLMGAPPPSAVSTPRTVQSPRV